MAIVIMAHFRKGKAKEVTIDQPKDGYQKPPFFFFFTICFMSQAHVYAPFTTLSHHFNSVIIWP